MIRETGLKENNHSLANKQHSRPLDTISSPQKTNKTHLIIVTMTIGLDPSR